MDLWCKAIHHYCRSCTVSSQIMRICVVYIRCYRRDGYSSGPESTRTSKSVPWESQHHHRGYFWFFSFRAEVLNLFRHTTHLNLQPNLVTHHICEYSSNDKVIKVKLVIYLKLTFSINKKCCHWMLCGF